MKKINFKKLSSILQRGILLGISAALLTVSQPAVFATVIETPAFQSSGYYPTIVNHDFRSSGRIWIAGDSIAADHSYENKNDYVRFVHGWGEIIGQSLTKEAAVFNKAISGQSAKYFVEEQNYKDIQSQISAGDFLIISFGHNDYKSDGINHSKLGSDVEGSYKWYLKNYYIDPALKASAMPVLCTSVVLCDFAGDVISKNQRQMQFVNAMKELYLEYAAQGIAIGLIDTNALTQDFYNADAENASRYFALRYDSPAHTSTSLDRVHSSYQGASAIADMILQNLSLMYPDFTRYVLQGATDGGNGTKEDPYLISSWLQWYRILQDEKLNAPDKYYRLTSDLLPRLQNTEEETVFYANLDGDGHTIYNPTGNVMRSFLDENHGVLSNLKLNYRIFHTLAVPQCPFVMDNYGIITDCQMSGAIYYYHYPEEIEQPYTCGSFAAVNHTGASIVKCKSSCALALDSNVSQLFLGGIAGKNSGQIADCQVTGAITLDSCEFDSRKPMPHAAVVTAAGGITALSDADSRITDCNCTSVPECRSSLVGLGALIIFDNTASLTTEKLSGFLLKATLGDITMDGQLALDDAQTLLSYALRLKLPETGEIKRRADVNGDGVISLADVRMTLRAALKIEPLFSGL